MAKSSYLTTGAATALALVMGGSAALAIEIPADDPGLFTYLFTEKTVPKNWIAEPAEDELTPAMMREIALRLSASGGTYQDATKSPKGWVLDFQNGTVRARIVRATNNKLIGVFFSKLE